jgi:hypothetical protein
MLWAFKFNPKEYQISMKCLLRHKKLHLVKERMEFLKMMDAKLMIELDKVINS